MPGGPRQVGYRVPLFLPMTTHSVTEARSRLSELIDRALRGEDIVIARRGRPVVELRAIARQAKPLIDADLDWLASQRRLGIVPATDAAELVGRLRDEWER